jgi:hypothetical protein
MEQSKTSRRGFITGGTATTFSIVSAQAVRGSQANSKVTFGLIGSGGRGTHDANIVHSDPRAEVVALCDLFDDRIDAAATKLKLNKPAVYKDYEKLLASNVDAVIIATPPFEHPKQLEAAVQARKHVYCEKPMGVDYEGCKRVIAAARKADPKKCLSVGFQQRYGPVYLEGYKRILSRVDPTTIQRSKRCVTGSATAICQAILSSNRIATTLMSCIGSLEACRFAPWATQGARCGPRWRFWII